ncbi:MAG: peptidoglycan editing factor PgeF [Gammaproteobacteria bacterium]|nr:peptidoglycan editing factor PgeF [Pseudomonadales bacterium]MCP5345691.1 peptidoglycan editing factor PgeF [Pseudomonadales bacterium]
MNREQQPPSYITPDWSVPDSVVALTTTRAGGCSEGAFASFNLALHVQDNPVAVTRNRRLLADRLAGDLTFQWLEQVHGTDVLPVSVAGPARRADAAFTTRRKLACCVLTADCLPVFFASNKGDAVAVAHAGWRGLAAGILERTLAEFPSPPDATAVWLGPAIGPCHFEVGAEVREEFLAAATGKLAEELAACFSEAPGTRKYLADLYGLARTRLHHRGVVSITGGGHCTFCQSEQFFSFRRQPETGRMASLIYLKT